MCKDMSFCHLWIILEKSFLYYLQTIQFSRFRAIIHQTEEKERRARQSICWIVKWNMEIRLERFEIGRYEAPLVYKNRIINAYTYKMSNICYINCFSCPLMLMFWFMTRMMITTWFLHNTIHSNVIMLNYPLSIAG